MVKKFIASYKKWHFFIPMILFFIISYIIFSKKVLPIDILVYEYVSKLINPSLTKIMLIVTMMGSSIVMIITGLFVYYKNKKDGIILLTNLAVIYIINELIKLIFSRPRPNINQLTNVSGFSYPSGHAMVSLCFYGLCIYLLMKSNYDYKKEVSIFISLLIILIGFSRIYLGVHYFSDVLAGFLFSISYLTFIINKFLFKT